MQPWKAIKIPCKDCQPENKILELCQCCYFQNKALTNLKKIKAYCKWCLNGHQVEICNSSEFNLFIFRLGKNPARLGIGGKHSQNLIKIAS